MNMANVWQIETPRNWCYGQRVTGCVGVNFGKSGGLGVLLCRALDFAVTALLNAYDIPLADEGVEVVGDGTFLDAQFATCASCLLSGE